MAIKKKSIKKPLFSFKISSFIIKLLNKHSKDQKKKQIKFQLKGGNEQKKTKRKKSGVY